MAKAKQNKHQAKASAGGIRRESRATMAASAADAGPAIVAAPPAKRPSLLAISILLFAIWFAFLLATALLG